VEGSNDKKKKSSEKAKKEESKVRALNGGISNFKGDEEAASENESSEEDLPGPA